MIRISSLPSAEHCGKAASLGAGVSDLYAQRSVVFHAYCATGTWPSGYGSLPVEHRDEIAGWKVPARFEHKLVPAALDYGAALKEFRVSLDASLNPVETPPGATQEEVEATPGVALSGTLDFAWEAVDADLVVVGDIKSSIFAVSDGPNSLQLHGYGIALCRKFGFKRYLTTIWDASDGRYYTAASPVTVDGLDGLEVQGRILAALGRSQADYVTGTHCTGCWKRNKCPAHLVDVAVDSRFHKLFSGEATAVEVRQALVAGKALKDLAEKVETECRDWVKRNGQLANEDGSKSWGPHLRKGRKSLDVGLLEEASGLKVADFQAQGRDYEVFDWRAKR